MPAKRTTSKKAAPARASRASRRTRASAALPDLVYAQASPRSIGGTSLFDVSGPITADSAMAFSSEAGMIRNAASRLQAAGFQVLQISPLTINIAGPPSLYEQVFNTSLQAEERPVIKEGAVEDTATFIDTTDTAMPGLIDTSGTPMNDVLEGVAIEEPVYFHESAFAPTKAYWHLRVPGDVSLGTNADKAHRSGVSGKDIRLVMVDSGHYRHPFFDRRGYRVNPVVLGPAATEPTHDESGHGTGESANAFAVAPDIDFTMVKINFTNSTGAFNAAVALNPHIISCSWGSSVQFGPLSAANTALGAAIALAVANGIVVVFSAGNGHWGFPGQHPDVISAGGVFMNPDDSLRASDYSSGFASNIYTGRNVPDVSGLVGMQPGASYIMLPVEPGDDIDTNRAGGTHPGTAATPRDETGTNDGWGVFSGTSAAAPQIAGVCALIKQVCPGLTPAQVKDILRSTAVDVTAGTNHPNFGNAAGPGFDLATGAGLVDAHRAVLAAHIRCLVVQPPLIQPPVVTPIQPPTVLPPTVIPPLVQPPVVMPPLVRPPLVMPPVVMPPLVRPPLVMPPLVRPPLVAPPVVNPPVVAGPSSLDVATVVAQLSAAGYSDAEIQEWLAHQQQATGITAEEAAALEQAILDPNTDLNL